MRTRIPLPVLSAKPSGEVVFNTKQQSTYKRTKQLCNELGIDPVQHQRDSKWSMLVRMQRNPHLTLSI
jgi:hypothetical protein